jgi:hypothetical protein
VVVQQTEEKRKVKLIVSMNLHGLATVESATLNEEEEYEEPVKVTKEQPAAAAAAPAEASGAEAPMEAEPATAAAAEGAGEAGWRWEWGQLVPHCTLHNLAIRAISSPLLLDDGLL